MKPLFVLALFVLTLFAEDMVVTIRYNNGMPDKVVQTTYTPGASALSVLQQVSAVQTSKTRKYLFVRSIDGVQSQIGTFGWFYTIDEKPVNTTAQNTLLKDTKTMMWVYKVEACY
ncbi:DUF4430 domain-containing protein [Sulfuricurvum sp.]|uniref:DUF4430 domain-containing protein n=1 Tax=Sulfuricurvum sp. TaxID=2025608 RepID=UPI00356699FF